MKRRKELPSPSAWRIVHSRLPVATDQAHSALILLSVIASTLEQGDSYTVNPSDLRWIHTILQLMPEMPLEDGK